MRLRGAAVALAAWVVAHTGAVFVVGVVGVGVGGVFSGCDFAAAACCQSDADCVDGAACVGSACALHCDTTAQCDEGQTCQRAPDNQADDQSFGGDFGVCRDVDSGAASRDRCAGSEG